MNSLPLVCDGLGEILRYKLDWEERCAEGDAHDIDSPVEEIHETKVLGANKHEMYPFNMEAGALI